MRWRDLRAGLIALAMIVGLLDGCPVPATPADRAAMRANLGPTLAGAVDDLDRARKAVLEPFQPIADLGRLRQRWKLFAGAPRDRFRMRVEARTGPSAPWDLLYRVHDPEHAFLADPLEYRRVRAIWSPHGSTIPGGYSVFVSWIARQVFARYPQYVEVRVSEEKIVIGPRGGYHGTGVLIGGQTRRRGAP